MEFDTVLHEPDVSGNGECPTDFQVVLLGYNDSLNALSSFEQRFLPLLNRRAMKAATDCYLAVPDDALW